MTRTTLDLDDAVLRKLRRRRDREGRSIGAIASELLASALRMEAETAPVFRWASQPMVARVDLDDKDAVWAVLDQG
jgi:plasmid stability protein